MSARALILIALLALPVAACSGGGSTTGTAAPTARASAGGPGATSAASAGGPAATSAGQATPQPTTAATLPGGGGAIPTLRPTGAKLRIANLYRDAAGKGTDLDVYGGFSAKTSPKLVTVPYGTVTDFFDPGAKDDQGSADWTFYPAGKTERTDQVGEQQETLKGTEQITIAMADGDSKSSTGTQLGRWKTFFETSTENPLPTAPTAADAVLMVDGVGLATMPGTTEDFVWVGVDGTCLNSVEAGTGGGAQPWGPGSQQNYIYPAGSHAVSQHLATPDCKAKSPYEDTTVNLTAGQRAFLFYYTPDDKALKGLLVPVQ